MTFCLGSKRSTTELYPQITFFVGLFYSHLILFASRIYGWEQGMDLPHIYPYLEFTKD
jgi:hypothetical protein